MPNRFLAGTIHNRLLTSCFKIGSSYALLYRCTCPICLQYLIITRNFAGSGKTCTSQHPASSNPGYKYSRNIPDACMCAQHVCPTFTHVCPTFNSKSPIIKVVCCFYATPGGMHALHLHIIFVRFQAACMAVSGPPRPTRDVCLQCACTRAPGCSALQLVRTHVPLQ